MKEIAHGAEAVIYREKDRIVKSRISKSYRNKELDHLLRQFRTRREAKILQKLQGIDFPAPRLIAADDKDMIIAMDFINGDKLRDVLEKIDYARVCREIGIQLAVLHSNNIMHADLTTSNMIWYNNKVYFIDFGLSFFSTKIEDRAVDLHLIRHALESYHYKIWKKAFQNVLQGYRKYSKYKDVAERLEQVEARGRNKGK